jgi:hypothetical protein
MYNRKIVIGFILIFGFSFSLIAQKTVLDGGSYWYPHPTVTSAATGNYGNWQIVDFFNPWGSGNRVTITGGASTIFGFVDRSKGSFAKTITWEEAQCLLNIQYQHNPSASSCPTVFVWGTLDEATNTITNVTRINIVAHPPQLGESKVKACLAL